MYGTTPGAGAGQAIFTDDVSLQVFMEHLKRLVSSFNLYFNGLCSHLLFTGCWCPNELIFPRFVSVLFRVFPVFYHQQTRLCYLCLLILEY